MKKILFLLLAFPFYAIAQTPFIGAADVTLRNSAIATYTNTVTTDQALISSTVKANSMTVDRPYGFTCDLSMNTAIVTLPTISFNVKLGAKSLTFISNAIPAINLSNSVMTISGYMVLRENGDVFVKFAASPTGAVSPLSLTSSNTTQFAVWTDVNITTDNAFSVNVSFSSTTTSTTITRQYYARSIIIKK